MTFERVDEGVEKGKGGACALRGGSDDDKGTRGANGGGESVGPQQPGRREGGGWGGWGGVGGKSARSRDCAGRGVVHAREGGVRRGLVAGKVMLKWIISGRDARKGVKRGCEDVLLGCGG